MKEPKRFDTIDGESLMNRPLESPGFVVDTLLGQGLHLLAGAAKVGKSWLALWLAVCVAKGESVWNLATRQGETLYLCLEDNLPRIQNRLLHITDDAPPTVHFTTSACTLGKGLEEQIETFMTEHPGTVLIIVDTIQMVRNTVYDNTYASDYKDLTALKTLADNFGIAILLIHHLRKEGDPDPFNRISGTTGMQGAVDSSFTLVEDRRGSSRAKLYCVGRDIEYREMELQRNKENIWELVADSRHHLGGLEDKLVQWVEALMQEQSELKGTPTKMAEMLNTMHAPGDDMLTGRSVFRRLKESQRALSSLGIEIKNYSSNGKRLIRLWRSGDDDDDGLGAGPGTPNTVSIDTGAAVARLVSTPQATPLIEPGHPPS